MPPSLHANSCAIERRGGRVLLNSRVAELVAEGGAVTGVRLADGTEHRAGLAVVSNADAWRTARLLPAELAARLGGAAAGTNLGGAAAPKTPSFVHLHVALRADGLPAGEALGMHHIVVDSWARQIGRAHV
jgi:phytoene dehydrogenase-like protein